MVRFFYVQFLRDLNFGRDPHHFLKQKVVWVGLFTTSPRPRPRLLERGLWAFRCYPSRGNSTSKVASILKTNLALGIEAASF